MKHYFVTFLLFLGSLSSYSQKADTAYLDKLISKSFVYKEQKKLDSAILYLNELLKAAQFIKDTLYLLKSYDRLAHYYKLNNLPFESAKSYIKSKELNLLLRDTALAIDKLRFVASIQRSLGDLNSSENSVIEALELSESLPNLLQKNKKLALYNQLGITTKEQINYRDALIWYHKALAISKDPFVTDIIKGNIAVIEIKLKNYQKAVDDLSELVEKTVHSQKTKEVARFKDNLAYSQSKLKYPNAEQELLEVLQLRIDIKDISGQFASYIHITEHFLYNQDTIKALQYAKNAYKTAHILKKAVSKTEALSYLIKLEKNPKKSANKYYQLIDSITKGRQIAKNQFAKIKYETEESREKILLLLSEKSQQELIIQRRKTQNILYAGLGICILFISLFFYFYRKAKHRKEKLQEVYKTEKRISKKVHDELANDLYQVMIQIENKENTIDPVMVDKLEDIYNRTRDISRDNNSIHTGKNYADELKHMLSRYGTDTTNIIITGLNTVLWQEVPAYKKIENYRVLQEIMTNMKKHSYANLVALTFKKEANHILINYADNGIGLQNNPAHIPNGLLNVENRITAIKGIVTFETTPEKGLKIQFSFPI